MSNKQFKATSLLTILSLLGAVIVVASFVGIYYGQDLLRKYKEESYQITSGSTTKPIDPLSMQQLQSTVDTNGQYSKLAADLMVPFNEYRDIAMKSLNSYASAYGISIKSSSFSETNSIVGAKDLKPVNITLNLNNPVPIDGLVKFMKSIENNIPKMQLSGVNIVRSGDSSNLVDVEPLTIEMYSR